MCGKFNDNARFYEKNNLKDFWPISRTVLLNVPLMILLYTLTCACGLVVYAYYTKEGCDPLRNGDISSENQV